MQRPLPRRADSIGPWIESLGFLTWLGTLTTAALTYMFSGDADSAPDGTPKGIRAWALLLTVFTAELSFLVVRWVVRSVISTLESDGEDGRQAQDVHAAAAVRRREPQGAADARRSRSRRRSCRGVEQPFWAKQKGWSDVCKAGGSIMERLSDGGEDKKEK